MSSRLAHDLREEDDYYPSPSWSVRALMEAYWPAGGRWLEPAIGDGVIPRVVSEYRPDVSWSGVDVQDRTDGSVPIEVGSFFDLAPSDAYDVVITNPPYSLAMEFIRHSMKFEGATVIMLLRLNFLGSAKRADFLRENPPDVYVLANRPSFVGGKTDSCDYAWFVWPGGKKRSKGSIQVLRTFSVDERRAE